MTRVMSASVADLMSRTIHEKLLRTVELPRVASDARSHLDLLPYAAHDVWLLSQPVVEIGARSEVDHIHRARHCAIVVRERSCIPKIAVGQKLIAQLQVVGPSRLTASRGMFVCPIKANNQKLHTDTIVGWHNEATVDAMQKRVRTRVIMAAVGVSDATNSSEDEMGNYSGVVIEESLSDKTVLQELTIVSTQTEPTTPVHKTPWLTQWTLHTIEISDAAVADVAEKIRIALDREHGSAWYADFNNETFHYIVFPNRVFCVDMASQEQYDEAKRHGIALGIPEYQVDFHPEIPQWTRP